jgi:hypothetical protein
MSLTENVARAKTDYDKVYEAGIDEMWDAFTNRGLRVTFDRAFNETDYGGKRFPDGCTIQSSSYMFYNYSGTELPSNIDLSNVTAANLSNGTASNNLFAWATALKSIYDLKLGAPSSYVYTFTQNHSLTTIEMPIKVKETTTFTSPFTHCYALESVTFEGTIGQGNLNFSYSKKLNKASIINIIEHLSTTTSGLAVTISKTAVDNAFETSAGAADGSTSQEWDYLVGTRQNWTINLLDS